MILTTIDDKLSKILHAVWALLILGALQPSLFDNHCLLLSLPAAVLLRSAGWFYWILLSLSFLICLNLLIGDGNAGVSTTDYVGLGTMALCGILRLGYRDSDLPGEAQDIEKQISPELFLQAGVDPVGEDRASAEEDETLFMQRETGKSGSNILEDQSVAEDLTSEFHSNISSEVDNLKREKSKHRTLIEKHGSPRAKLTRVLDLLRESGDFAPRQIEMVEETLVNVFGDVHLSETSSHEFSKGKQFGEYVIERVLGRGGAAVVYLAVSESGELVAIKVLHNAKFGARFEREMNVVQHLAHPHIVVAYEVGIYEGVDYLVMEYLPGGNLYQFVKNNGPLSWEDSLEVIFQAALGLQHAHQRGLVHRDVKPGNLMWDLDRQVKLTDLGLAGIVESIGDSEEAEFETKLESVGGTPDFMAPEQSIALCSATERSDIYALGATWYYLLTGRSRNRGTGTVDKLRRLKRADLETLPREVAPPQLQAIWRRMTKHVHTERYASCDELLADLEPIRPEKQQRKGVVNLDVLVVEDDRDDLFVTLETLKRTNQLIQTKAVQTLAEAIDLAKQNQKYDAILLDLNLLDSQGLDTVKRMREAFTDSPIIVLTGRDDIQFGKSCIIAGADEYICKADLTVQQLERSIFITQSRVNKRRLPNQ